MTITQQDGQRAELSPRVPAAGRVGQATSVEQTRALAEVEAMIVVAMRYPRNVAAAIDEMRQVCKQKGLAERAFFAYPRGGKTVTGPSIHLAKELVRIWGNVNWGLRELRRDDDYGQSEMLAFAWDIQTNMRVDNVFINPHRQYTGNRELSDLRDVYENNANVGSRRARAAIFNALPTWFVDEAIELCEKTLKDGGGIPLPQRRANAIEVFGNIGITVPQLEARMEKKADEWNDHDVAQLRIIRQSLLRGEITKDEAFPAVKVTADDILNQAKSDRDKNVPGPAESGANPADGGSTTAGAGEPGGPGTPAEDGEPAGPMNQGPRPVSAAELGRTLAALPFQAQEIKDFLSWRAGRPVNGIKDLEEADRWAIASYIAEAKDAAEGDPSEAVSAIWTEYRIDKGIAEPGSQA